MCCSFGWTLDQEETSRDAQSGLERSGVDLPTLDEAAADEEAPFGETDRRPCCSAPIAGVPRPGS